MESLAAILDALPAWLLFGLACAGHAFFMIVSLNVLYGWPLPHALLRVTRKIDILIILAGPLLFLYALGVFDGKGLSWEPGHRGYLVTPYTVFCIVVGCTAAPAAIVLYHLRRTPPHLVEVRGQVVDVARELGYPPAGTGKQRGLRRLPVNQCFQVEFAQR